MSIKPTCWSILSRMQPVNLNLAWVSFNLAVLLKLWISQCGSCQYNIHNKDSVRVFVKSGKGWKSVIEICLSVLFHSLCEGFTVCNIVANRLNKYQVSMCNVNLVSGLMATIQQPLQLVQNLWISLHTCLHVNAGAHACSREQFYTMACVSPFWQS